MWIMPPGAEEFSRKFCLLDAIGVGFPTALVSRHWRLLEMLSWRQQISGRAGGLVKCSWGFSSSIFPHCHN